MNTYEVKIMVVKESENKYTMGMPEDIKAFWENEIKKASWFQDEKECFIVLIMDTSNQIKTYNLVTMGLIDRSIIHPREVFRPAIIAGATKIIVCHNHPSGQTEPSEDDIAITKKLVDAGKIIGIKLVDHIIIGNGLYSFLRNGKL